MIGILRESGSIAAHVRSSQVENAHAETLNAPDLPLNICTRVGAQ
jgi:hypothetical protein